MAAAALCHSSTRKCNTAPYGHIQRPLLPAAFLLVCGMTDLHIVVVGWPWIQPGIWPLGLGPPWIISTLVDAASGMCASYFITFVSLDNFLLPDLLLHSLHSTLPFRPAITSSENSKLIPSLYNGCCSRSQLCELRSLQSLFKLYLCKSRL